MNQLKKLAPIILVLSAILILVFARNSDPDLFKAKVNTAVEKSRDRANLITSEELGKLPESWLLLDLSLEKGIDSLQFQRTANIPMDHLLDKSTLKMLDETKGAIVLRADEIGTAANAWVILNQLGYTNLRILRTEEDPEVLKYKFQPDTTVRLELNSTE
jgi:hypothetical protein